MRKIKIFLGLILLLTLFAPGAYSAGSVRAVTNGEYLEACLSTISKAASSIDIATLAFDNDTTANRIKDALYKAVNRGVALRIILDDSAAKKDGDVIEELRQAGIALKLDGPRRTLHEKLIIVDRRIVLFGSTNLGSTSIDRNNETDLLVDDKETGDVFNEYFEALWHEPDRQVRFPAAVSSGLLIPLNAFDYSRKLPGIIRAARKRVWAVMYDARVYEPGSSNPTAEIYEALSSARVAGVDVRVLLEKSDHDKELNASNTETAMLLLAEKIQVRRDPEDIITHAKLVIADDSVITGSSNWNARSLRVNNEVNALITIPSVTSSFSAYFEKLWQEATQD